MNRHRFGVTGGPHPASLRPTLDGEPMKGVTAFRIEADVHGSSPLCEVTLTLLAELDVDVEANVTPLLFIPPESWWERMRRRFKELVRWPWGWEGV